MLCVTRIRQRNTGMGRGQLTFARILMGVSTGTVPLQPGVSRMVRIAGRLTARENTGSHRAATSTAAAAAVTSANTVLFRVRL